MRPLLALACLALLTATLAGCAEDPERYPDGVPRTTTSRSPSATATATGTSTAPPANAAPTAGLDVSPVNGSSPLNVTFSLTGSDPDSDPLTWELVFGDGNRTEGTTLPAAIEHSYASAGNYTASLTVSDGSLNRTATAHVAVAGAGAPVEPTIEELCPTDTEAVGNEDAGYYATPNDSVDAPGSLWIYEESNGMPGLQRDDDTVPTDCPTPDTIIF